MQAVSLHISYITCPLEVPNKVCTPMPSGHPWYNYYIKVVTYSYFLICMHTMWYCIFVSFPVYSMDSDVYWSHSSTSKKSSSLSCHKSTTSTVCVGLQSFGWCKKVCIVYVLCVFLYDPDYMPYYFGWFAFLASVLYYDNRMSKKINLYRNYAENNLQDRTVSLQPSFLVHLIFFV